MKEDTTRPKKQNEQRRLECLCDVTCPFSMCDDITGGLIAIHFGRLDLKILQHDQTVVFIVKCVIIGFGI